MWDKMHTKEDFMKVAVKQFTHFKEEKGEKSVEDFIIVLKIHNVCISYLIKGSYSHAKISYICALISINLM